MVETEWSGCGCVRFVGFHNCTLTVSVAVESLLNPKSYRVADMAFPCTKASSHIFTFKVAVQFVMVRFNLMVLSHPLAACTFRVYIPVSV